MRILQIAPPWINTPPQEYGGTEQVIYNLVSGFDTLGHEVTLFATKKSESPQLLRYVYATGLSDQKLPWEAALPALVHYHQAFKLASEYDFVHAHLSSQTDLMILPFLADLAENHIPSVMTIHGHMPYDRFSHADQQFIKFYASHINVINISYAMVPYVPRQFQSVGVVHNSLDVNKFTFYRKPGKYLTWLGKIVPDKNPHEAILIAKKVGMPMIFGGVVDKQNPISVRYFETKVKPLIDNKQIHYIGPVNLKKKNRLLGEAYGFIYPHQWEEPFGMVMLEAMASGTPVITYDKGAAPELVISGKTGFVVTSRQNFIKAIPKLASLNRISCRQHVALNFSPIEAAQSHLEIYRNIIEQTELNTIEPVKTSNMMGTFAQLISGASKDIR